MTINEIQDYLRNAEEPTLRYFAPAVASELSDLAAVLLYDIQYVCGAEGTALRD